MDWKLPEEDKLIQHQQLINMQMNRLLNEGPFSYKTG